MGQKILMTDDNNTEDNNTEDNNIERTGHRMRVTYIGHSGFLLEWEHCYWLFDYYQGVLPDLDGEKQIIVFCSHSHGDHFNPAVFALAQAYPHVSYVFSSQVKPSCRKLSKNVKGIHLSEKQVREVCASTSEKMGKGSMLFPVPEVLFLPSRTDTEVMDGHGDLLKIHTLQSTDCGCGFFITYKGKTVYHAGDLHWWFWPGEPELDNKQMTGNYKKEMEYLEGKTIDYVFTPLDGRQEEAYGLGMDYLLHHAQVRHAFPMHFWKDYTLADRFLKEYELPAHTMFYKIGQEGQSWEFIK